MVTLLSKQIAQWTVGCTAFLQTNCPGHTISHFDIFVLVISHCASFSCNVDGIVDVIRGSERSYPKIVENAQKSVQNANYIGSSTRHHFSTFVKQKYHANNSCDTNEQIIKDGERHFNANLIR